MNNDIRWKQRFQNFEKAYEVLNRRIADYEQSPESESHQMSLIQGYEMVFELSWKTMKDYLESHGYDDLGNARKTIRQAFQDELVHNAETWMEGLKQRNQTSHIYNEAVMREVIAYIHTDFYSIVRDLYFDLKKEL